MRLQILSVLGSLLLIPAFALADDDAKALVQGLLARDEAWTSGRFVWGYGVAVDSQKVVRGVDASYYSFDGESWSEGGVGYGGGENSWNKPMTANHNGYLATYRESPPDTKELREKLKVPSHTVIQSWKKVVLSGPVPSNYTLNKGIRAMPPIWAGAIWSRKARDWIAKHVDDFTFVGGEVVDGIPTKVVKATVGSFRNRIKNDGRSDTGEVFDVWHKDFTPMYPKEPDKGHELRLYIAPSLGYVLPRVDGVTVQGNHVQKVTQTGFKKYTDGIYLPSRSDNFMVIDEGDLDKPKQLRHQWYTLSDIQMVNEPIPEEDFIIIVPAGTEVVDMRDRQHPVRFEAVETATSENVEKRATELRANGGNPPVESPEQNQEP